MTQQYLSLFDVIAASIEDVAKVVEPALATSGFDFDGVVRKFERGSDQSLYYAIASGDVQTWSAGVAYAREKSWPGVAFECRYRGNDVTVGFFTDRDGSTLCIDYDSTVFYDIERDVEVFEEWLASLLQIVDELKFTASVFRRGGLKEAVTPSAVVAAVRDGTMLRQRNPLLVIVHNDALVYDEAIALGGDKLRVSTTSTGYVVLSRLHLDR